MVVWPELRHAFAHGFDHTGAVRHQYPTVSGRETSLGVPRRPNRLASPGGRCRWRSCSRMPFLRLLMFLVFVFSWCFTPHFNPIELRFICGSPILSNHCLFVRTL